LKYTYYIVFPTCKKLIKVDLFPVTINQLEPVNYCRRIRRLDRQGYMDLSRNLSPNTGELLVNSYIVAKNKQLSHIQPASCVTQPHSST
jgi:hypothetical protein